MKIELEKIVKHKVKITIDKDTYSKFCDIVQKSSGIDEVIAFNAIKRIGNAYKKKLCWISYRTEARKLAIIDTLRAIGVEDFISIKAHTNINGYKDCCVEYSKFDNWFQKPIVNIVFEKEE